MTPSCKITNQISAGNNLFVPVIGFCGKAGSGKTTAASFLTQQHGYARLKFADPMKEMAKVLGLYDEHLEGTLKEKPCDLLGGRSPRYLLQTLGTEWGRNLMGKEFWVRIWVRKAMDLLTHYGKLVVDDIRFQNEADAVRSLGGIIIKLEGHSTNEVLPHASESLNFQPDLTICNDQNLQHRRCQDWQTD